MMKAWQIERQKMDNAIPKILTEEEQTWNFAEVLEQHADAMTKLYWSSHVPGSYAPESIMIASIQAMENKGYVFGRADELIQQGLAAYEADDLLRLHEISGLLWEEIRHATPNKQHPYYSFAHYHSFEEVLAVIEFPAPTPIAKNTQLLEQIHAGWLAQIIGGAVGTAVEGYTTTNITKALGEVRHYIRTPNTYNDDITFELAFLKAYQQHGHNVTSRDIASMWLQYIPLAWSAEDFALRNLKLGIFPPESGRFLNPFSDWIGAQMRGAICGMIAPGNPKEAARLAWLDAVVSHDNNGALGEMFNAILVSNSFVASNVRQLVMDTLSYIPSDSEYYSFAFYALNAAQKHVHWLDAWRLCEQKFERYNWIHAYPNIMAEIIALWYGNGDFEETLHIIAQAGQDVDCNAAQILSAVGIMKGMDAIPNSFKDPIADRLDTYLRKDKVMSIKQLAQETYEVIGT
jgi:ADP-ribosylglycohydrolase